MKDQARRFDVVVTPFLGEFGHELMVWLPWLRYELAEFHSSASVLVLCRDGHEALYETLERSVTIEVARTPDVSNCDMVTAWVGGARLRHEDYVKLTDPDRIKRKTTLSPAKVVIAAHHDGYPVPLHGRHGKPFGEDVRRDHDLVVVHARNSRLNADRNWPMQSWDHLVQWMLASGLRVESIGAVGQSDNPVGANSRRGSTLREDIARLRKASFVIGPASGPLCLANLCGTRVVWWGGGELNARRFSANSEWNPHGVPNHSVSPVWDPSLAAVKRSVEAMRSLIAIRDR